VHVDGAGPRVLQAREGRGGASAGGLPLLTLVAGARLGVVDGVRRGRGRGSRTSTLLSTADGRGGVEGSRRQGRRPGIGGLQFLEEKHVAELEEGG
jgi:hypothetical protein